MVTQTTWLEEFIVRSHETDFQEHWKPSSFFQAMQEATVNHANHLGFGIHDMLKRDLVWIMTRVKVYFFDFPGRGEHVLVNTWPKGIHQKLFFMRDYRIERPDGGVLALATSAWVVVNPKVRRILSPEVLTDPFPDNDGKFVLDETLEKIPPSFQMDEKFRTLAAYSALDIVGHVNNIRYIDWACDCFPLEYYKNKKLKRTAQNLVGTIY